MIARRDAAAALAALVLALGTLSSQAPDSVPPVRHILAFDYTRVRPFSRSYDMVVVNGDSSVSIGRRDVTLTEVAVTDSSAGWLLVESRTGVVSSTDSILIASDLRPVRWRSTVGAASLALDFSSDSASGVVRVGNATSQLALAIPPDLIVSSPAIEMLAALLPLAPLWSDSANTLAVDVAGARTEAAVLAVTGEDSVSVSPGALPRPCWVLTLRSAQSETRMWVDRETRDVLRAQTTLPSDVGSVLEYRARPALTPAAP